VAPFHPLRHDTRAFTARAGAVLALFFTIAVVLLAGGGDQQLAAADANKGDTGAGDAAAVGQAAPSTVQVPAAEPAVVAVPQAAPPVETPPVETAPAEAPPAEAPPPQAPPAEPPPAEAPPAEAPPAEAPPAEAPPAAQPPAASKSGGGAEDPAEAGALGGGDPDDDGGTGGDDDGDGSGGGKDHDGDDDGSGGGKGPSNDDDDGRDGGDDDDDGGKPGNGPPSGDDDDDGRDGGGDDDGGKPGNGPPSGGGKDDDDDDDDGDDEPAPSGRGQVPAPASPPPGGDTGGSGGASQQGTGGDTGAGNGTPPDRSTFRMNDRSAPGERAQAPQTISSEPDGADGPQDISGDGGVPAGGTGDTGSASAGAGDAAATGGAGGAGTGTGAGAGGDGGGAGGGAADGAGGREGGGNASQSAGEDQVDFIPRVIADPVTEIVEKVPDSLKAALAALAALSVLLGVGYLLAALRARRLARQRRELLQEVGLLQTALLPPVPDKVGALLTSVAYRPADGPGAGGDFYDVIPLAGGGVGFILGDVSGHGRGALARTAFMRYTLRAYLEAGLEPRVALQVAGRVIDENLGGDFATVLLAVHNPETGSLTYATAGHPAPIVVGPEPHVPVTAGSSPPIGVGVRTGLRQTMVPLVSGSVAALFTDGLMEARTEKGILGRERLQELLKEMEDDPSAHRLIESVANEATLLSDDMAAVVVTPTAAAAAGLFRTEDLELSAPELDGPIARRFLEATGLPEADIAAAEHEARELAGPYGGVVLNVVYDDQMSVKVLPRNVESIEAASRRVSAGTAR
jgi:Stage II sporulation protein E (SpoIIE)